MKTDTFAIKNPVDEYHTEGYEKQRQPFPGLQREMEPVPDSGEATYKGTGRLQGRKALVTGGDSGIGRAVAIAYAREGADLAINYLPSEEADAQDLKALLEGEGRKITLIPGNLADEHFCIKLVDRVYDAMKGLDILALVAGRQVATKSIEEITTDQLEEVFAVNVYSLFWIVKQALPLLPEGASIITTSSIQAFDPSATLLDYASTKGAIKAFTQSLAKQLAPQGIRVNAVAPGPIWTPIQVSGGQLQEALPEFGQDTPLKRSGQPAELAGIYVFLASQESSYVTAQFFGITGGKTLA